MKTSFQRNVVPATALLLAGALSLAAGCAEQAGPPSHSSRAVGDSHTAPGGETAAATAAEALPQPADEATSRHTTATDAAASTDAGATSAAATAGATIRPIPEPTGLARDEHVEIGACDGTGAVTVPKTLRGRELADALLDQWRRDHPGVDWVMEEKRKHNLKTPADNSEVLSGGQGVDHAYGNFTEKDLLIWARETEKFVAEGSRIFHNAELLGSTVAVSCDMCHPHAANTHPETYPKFQTQLGQVALLRDMINWCIENPVRGPKLAPDSPAMRALEAYIMSQRQGVPMNFGKH